MRWDREEGFYLRDRHLDRLQASAEQFGFPCVRSEIGAALDRVAATLDGLCRVRLLLAADGVLSFETASLDPAGIGRSDIRFTLSPRAVDSSDPFRRHKTTRRGILDSERRRLAAETGCDEVIFANERGELTEGSYTTLFLQRGGILLTPPLACGLLDGTLRRELLAAGDPEVREEVLHPRDLETADIVWLGNSVRGLQRGQPAGDDAIRPAGPARRARADDGEDRR